MYRSRIWREMGPEEFVCTVLFFVIIGGLALLPFMSLPNHYSESFQVEATSLDNVAVIIDVHYVLGAARTSIDDSMSKYYLPNSFWNDVNQRLEEIVRVTIARQELAELTEGLVLDHEIGSALKGAFLEEGFDLTGTVEVEEIQVILAAAK